MADLTVATGSTALCWLLPELSLIVRDSLFERLEAFTPLINFFLEVLPGGLICSIQFPMCFDKSFERFPFTRAMLLEVA